MDNITKIRIDMKERVVELEGSEKFVEEQIKWIKEFIAKEEAVVAAPDLPKMGSTAPAAPPAKTQGDKYQQVFGIDKNGAESVYHFEKDKFTIITKKIKGINAAMQIDYMLLYCLAKEFFGNKESTYTELRELCDANGCLDGGNFSAYVANRKDLFVATGKRSKVVKLTSPGRNKAKELLSSLSVD